MKNCVLSVVKHLADAPSLRQRAGLCARRGRCSLGFAQTLILASLASALCLGAAESKTNDVPWVSLFNGRDLTGWKIVALTNPAPVVVVDGAMVLRQRINTKEHSFVASEREYKDFILELDLKDDPEFNSGILLRCVESSTNAAVRLNGYQVKIDNTARAWTGGVFDDFGDSWTWLHDLADNDAGRAAFKLGEWAHFRIECIGPTIKVWVNGVPTCHLADEKYRKGVIAFKIHSVGDNPKATQNVIRFKNIRIITEHPERFALPMELPPRRASAEPGKFDKAKPRPDRARLPAAHDRARLIVMADMGNEPDEEQQMLHLLMCANEFDLEGLITVPGKYLRPEDKIPFAKANHPPVAALNGDPSEAILKLPAKPGETLQFTAVGSTDADQDTLRFLWWNYPEAGRKPYGQALPLENATADKTQFTIPSDAAGQEVHLILEVWDHGPSFRWWINGAWSYPSPNQFLSDCRHPSAITPS